jgi:Undecaprenyl-phosphate glucose phosphotransferase
MLKQYHHIVGGIFRAIDALVIGSVWLLAYWLRFHLPLIQVTKGFPPFDKYASLSPLVIALWMIVFSAARVYHSQRMLRRTHEVQLILKAHLIAMLLFIAITYLFAEYKYSRGVVLYFGLLGAIFLVCFRLFLRNSLRRIRQRGFNLRHVIGIGEGQAIETLIHRLERFPELGLRIQGIVTHELSQSKSIAGKPVLGHFNEIHEIMRRFNPDEILLALPRNQYIDLDRILESLKEETIAIQMVPDIHEYVTLGCAVEDFDGLPIVNINDSPLHGWGAIAKRLTDILIASTALVVFFPFLLFVAIAIKLTSTGDVLFRQERTGLDGRTFNMLKFRSMQANAESSTGAVWAIPEDQRRTGIGTFLRKTSIDEIPQLWNVLKGDMSLVGPRPERPVFVQQFRKDIPHYMLRHKVKAGMTGWAQVNGWRGNTSLPNRIECDLFYIRNWSYLFDLKIILLTLWKGFIHKNAY